MGVFRTREQSRTGFGRKGIPPFGVRGCRDDALPGIGHACGHNVNGAAAVAAALALAPLADEFGLTVKLLGTPAEESGGGKVYLPERGAFDDVATAMMVHAAPMDCVGMGSPAISTWQVAYTGVTAHAAAMPHKGVNAADATEAIEPGGTITGEHGIGWLKRSGLNRESDPLVSDMHRAVKRALDPAGILKPGEVFAMDNR